MRAIINFKKFWFKILSTIYVPQEFECMATHLHNSVYINLKLYKVTHLVFS